MSDGVDIRDLKITSTQIYGSEVMQLSRTSSQLPKTNLMAMLSNIYSTYKIKKITAYCHDQQAQSTDSLLCINTITVYNNIIICDIHIAPYSARSCPGALFNIIYNIIIPD